VANTRSFVQYAVDLFAPLGDVVSRSMFGGHGLYLDGVMFGLLDDGELYLKTDDLCQAEFAAAGGKRWTYPSPKGPMETRYFAPPASAMENSDEMRKWFELSIAAALRKATQKKPRGKRRAK
jgi:DNA transformation protein and related proteins